MKTVTDTLGVARSNVAERLAGERRLRGPQTREGDLALTAHIRRLVDARPTYGYLRIGALLNRERRSTGWASWTVSLPSMSSAPARSPLMAILAPVGKLWSLGRREEVCGVW